MKRYSDIDIFRGLLNVTNDDAYTFSDAEIDTLVKHDISVRYAEDCLHAGCNMSQVVEAHLGGVPAEYLAACTSAGYDIIWALEAHAAGIPVEFGAA